MRYRWGLVHRPPMKKAGQTLLWAVAGFGAAIIVFGLSTSFWLSLLALVLTGAFDCISVPGSLEIPAAIAIAVDAAERKRRPYDGVVALGCVIRGDTIHFDIVAIQSARALMDLAVARRLPIGNGILTVDTEAQAWARARPEEADKGGDAARAALAMLRIKRRLAATRNGR